MVSNVGGFQGLTHLQLEVQPPTPQAIGLTVCDTTVDLSMLSAPVPSSSRSSSRDSRISDRSSRPLIPKEVPQSLPRSTSPPRPPPGILPSHPSLSPPRPPRVRRRVTREATLTSISSESSASGSLSSGLRRVETNDAAPAEANLSKASLPLVSICISPDPFQFVLCICF